MAKDALETQLLVKNSSEEVTQQLKKLREWQKEIKEKEKSVKMEMASTSNESSNEHDRPSVKRSKTMGDLPDNPEPMEDVDEEGLKLEADTYKAKGNNFVKLQDYDNAIHFYTKAIQLYDKDPFYHSNLALCYLRKERYNDCISECNAALKLSPALSKAFFRRAQAYECLGENQSAIEDMMRVIELEPTVTSHKRDLDRLQKRLNSDSIERASKHLEKRVWLSLNKNQKYVKFIHKAPNYRSKQPLKRIKVEEVLPSVPASVNDSGEKIPDAIIDKLFNNNTGECTAEPLPTRHTLDFGAFYRRRPKSPPQKPEYNDDIDDELPPPPTSGMQFWLTWKELSNQKRFFYLKVIILLIWAAIIVMYCFRNYPTNH
ncbi:RNA polymerase II-associated protein 3 isoform X2 [Culicoides brevitarsis]|uniref:RNA polymerase II-associated protein 3 isoform X2 n=1 Tax=Culicoides brevitarsis TaxID=469753 RepID=UPI00307B17D7